eukprot:732703-Pyramimonas_sp.AAC.1
MGHLTGSWDNEMLRQVAIEHRGHEHMLLRNWIPQQRVLEISSWERLDMVSLSPWCASSLAVGPGPPQLAGPPSLPADRRHAHAMYRALVDRVATWARQWVPSLVVASTGSDFQPWMDWCVEYVSDVLRYYGFRDLLRCLVGAASDQAVRWEVATEI